jgi:hypothetical protein
MATPSKEYQAFRDLTDKLLTVSKKRLISGLRLTTKRI